MANNENIILASSFITPKVGKKEGGSGRVSTTLAKNIAYEREPSLFDEAEIAERDTQIRRLNEEDAAQNLERRGKPVYLTGYQPRIIYALSYIISQEIGREDVARKIERPTEKGNTITLNVNVSEISELIFKSKRGRYKEKIIADIKKLAETRQVVRYKINDKDVKLTYPLIMLGATMEDLSKDKENDLDYMQIILGSAFFVDMDKRFAEITPKLFETWGKSGRGTDLYANLLSSILSVYWYHKKAARDAETRVRSDKGRRNLTKDELAEEIARAKREALTYELNFETIKKRVTTDYESERVYRKKFEKDLYNAIEGFKELDLITEGIIQRGARGQDKVIFVLSETYNNSEENKGTTPPLLEDKK